MAMALLGLIPLVIWELNHPNPILNLRLLGERNFLVCGLVMYLSFGVLYGSNVNLPQMLQELFGYDATRAGLVMSPAAFFKMAAMPLVGYLLGKGVDARYLVPIGLICVAGSSYWSAHLNLDASPFAIVAPRCLLMLGVGFLFVPLNNAAYLYLPRKQINNATGLFNMLRNEGGSLGIAIATTRLDRRSQFHQSRLAENVRPANPLVDQIIEQLTQLRIVRGGVSSVVGHNQALGLLSRMVREQARVIAYLDIFWLFWVMILATIPLVFLMKRSVARGELAAH